MKVTYIYHSCFSVELEKVQLVFDYYKGKLDGLSPNKPVYFFASHKHRDHFNMELFRCLDESYDVRYVLGSDIKLNAKYMERNGYDPAILDRTLRVAKNTEYNLENGLRIRTLKSTDSGVAFIVECEGIKLYHAGDNNPWCFITNEDTDNMHQEEEYLKQLMTIKGEHFDVAFIPLDYRQGGYYHLGMDYFMDMTDCDHVFPMHLWGYHKMCDEFIEKVSPSYSDQFVAVHHKNEEWIF